MPELMEGERLFIVVEVALLLLLLLLLLFPLPGSGNALSAGVREEVKKR